MFPHSTGSRDIRSELPAGTICRGLVGRYNNMSITDSGYLFVQHLTIRCAGGPARERPV
jgi:hypothetical protein